MNENILVTIEGFNQDAKEKLKGLGSVTCEILEQSVLEEKIGEYSVLLVGLGLTFYKETLDKATNLKVIATATTGLDHIDVAYAKSKGITVLSLKDEYEFLDTVTGTAELAFGLMLQLLRKIHTAHDAVVHKGEWRREDYRGQSLYGKTIGVVGMGRLGKIFAAGATGFRMNVLYTDPNVEQATVPGYRKCSFEELLSESDVISIHTHLTEETEGMFGCEQFEKMKNDAILINTARGKIVNETDLLEALREGQLGGYATDVLADELEFGENASHNQLVQYAKLHDNVVIVPHIGGMTVDSRGATDIFIAKKLLAHFKLA